ncbi:hypothetical protein CHUAL_010574 [Chamberlinius hualienensis]
MLRSIMRAVRVNSFGGPEVLKVDSIPIPTIQDNQVLIKIAATGINPVDTYIRSGIHAVKPNLPFTPGADGAGVVEAVGKTVTNLKVGQRVYTTGANGFNSSGTYAEYTAASADRVFPLSDKLSFEQGAALGVPYYTAYRALFINSKIQPGETVLIHGASGGVGIAAVQLASAFGAKVFATVGTKDGADIVKSAGAHSVFNHRETDYVDKLVKASEGRGFNVIIEMLANVNLVTDLSQLAAFKGRVIVVGSRGSVPEFFPRLLMGKELSLLGCGLLATTDCEWKLMTAGISGGIEAGYIKPVIDKQYSIDDVTKAHVDVINSTGAKGKLILKF